MITISFETLEKHIKYVETSEDYAEPELYDTLATLHDLVSECVEGGLLTPDTVGNPLYGRIVDTLVSSSGVFYKIEKGE